MASFHPNGYYGSHWWGDVTPSVNWQNEDANRSSVHVRLVMRADGGYSQVANTSYNVRINGGAIGSGSRSVSVNGNSVVLIDADVEIAHDGNGNWSGSYGGSFASGFAGVGSGGADWSWSVPSLYQAIDYYDIQFPNITDVGFQVYVSVNRTADLLQLSIDGGGWVTYYSGGYGNVTVTVGGASSPIVSGYPHTVRCRTRRASNGWVTDSGTYTITTKTQNSFFELGEF